MGLQPGTVPIRSPGGLFAGSASTGSGSSESSDSTSPQTAQQETGTRADSTGGGGGGGHDQQPHDKKPHLPATGTSPQPAAQPGAQPPAPPPRDTPQSRKLEQQIAGLKNQLKDIQARLARGGTPAEQSSLIHQQEALDLQIKQLEADAAHSRQNAASAPPEAKATEPDILKEAGMTATLAPDPELVYTSFPIEKMEQEGDTLFVYGKATTPELDSDEQVVEQTGR